MSVVPIDSFPPVPVPLSSDETAWRGPHEKRGDHHGHHGRGAPPAEAPSKGTEDAPGSESVGTIIDVRV